MGFAGSSRRGLEAALAFAATAALMFFGNGLEPVWPLAWIAPLPALWFVLRSSWWSGALVAGLAWLAGCLNLWGYFHLQGSPPAAWLVAFGLAAAMFALAALLFRALVCRGAVWSALAGFPAVWVTFEYVRNLAWPHGTAGSLAYSQLGFLPFLQMASLAGPWGMSFVLLLFPAGLAVALHLRRAAPAKSRQALAVTLGTIAAALIFGAVRLAAPQPGPDIAVGLVASDRDPARAGSDTERLLQAYAGEARELASHGAQIIVLPERLGTMTASDVAAGDAILQRLANETVATIVIGVERQSDRAAFNEARVYRPGAPVVSYSKQHLLPPFELRLTPGKALLRLQTASGPWGVAICKDMDFTPLLRKYGQAGVGLMLVPAWDFDMDRAWHGHMAVMRGVENGFSVVRSAKHGYLTASDNRGRILAERRSDAAPFATLAAHVPTGHTWTVFQLLGDWFAWVAIALAGWAAIRLVWRSWGL